DRPCGRSRPDKRGECSPPSSCRTTEKRDELAPLHVHPDEHACSMPKFYHLRQGRRVRNRTQQTSTTIKPQISELGTNLWTHALQTTALFDHSSARISTAGGKVKPSAF